MKVIFRPFFLGLFVFWIFFPFLSIIIWSVAAGWRFPALLPEEYSLRGYEVSFDPAGTARKTVLEIGKIVDNQVIKDEKKQGFKKLSFVAASKLKSSTISVDQKILKNRNGLISVTLSTNGTEYALVNVKVNAAKKYSSCKELNKDYPGGVVASSKWNDIKSSKQRVGYVAKPILNIRTFYLNRKLDLDNDKVVCELNN